MADIHLPPQVMVVEDQTTMRQLLVMILEAEKLTVVAREYTSLPDLMGEIEQSRPQLILLDIYLNRFSGMDVLQVLRKEGYPYHPYVLMTSGSDHGEECLAKGADAFLAKPYSPRDLVRHIRTYLDGQ